MKEKKKRISLRNENGQVVESIVVDTFSLEVIPKEWEVQHNYSIWFEDEKEQEIDHLK